MAPSRTPAAAGGVRHFVRDSSDQRANEQPGLEPADERRSQVITNGYDLVQAFANVDDGGTITIGPGTYNLTPQIPEDIAHQQNCGAALALVGKNDVTIQGVGDPVLRTTRHGSMLYLGNCHRVTIRGIIAEGNGHLTDCADWYFAMFVHQDEVDHPTYENVVCRDYGNHGIGHLQWGLTHHGVFRDCLFQRGGTLNLKRDGAAIACGGSDNLFEHITVEDCLVGLEWETKFNIQTKGNLCRGLRVYRPLWRPVFIYPSHQRPEWFWGNQIVDTFIDGEGHSAEYGIGVHGGSGLAIRGAVIRNIGGGMGVMLSEQACDISDTLIEGVQTGGEGMATGIHLAQSNGFAIRRTTVANCQIGPCPNGRGIWADGAGVVLTGNQIHDCGTPAKRWEGIYRAPTLTGLVETGNRLENTLECQ